MCRIWCNRRDQWNAVARARHNRDANGASEPALDLLEAYLKHGKNFTSHEGARWSGEYPLSVLAEAIKRLAPRLGASSARDLAAGYPKVRQRDALEGVLYDIGVQNLGFDGIRKADFGAAYGISAVGTGSAGTGGRVATGTSAKPSATASTATGTATGGGTTTTPANAVRGKTRAPSIDDPRAVRRTLKQFSPRGENRGKVTALRDEAIHLDLATTPMAFCFVLRSMFEISAKAYCDDHAAQRGPAATRADGTDRKVVEILRDITTHLTKNNADKAMTKALHGAMTELARPTGLLSVTSLNQLVHNLHFKIAANDIALLFGNVFPLLKAMNA